MPGRDKLSNLRSVSITQSPTTATNKSYSLYLPTRPDFLNFLCERWYGEEQLGGGFKDETKSVLFTAGIVKMSLPWNQRSKRVILHSIQSVQKEDVERIIIHTNDTDTVVISCVYYASMLLRYSELSMWVRTARGSYLPIHGITAAVGPSTSHALPFIHSLSERDTTSCSYFTGKKTCINLFPLIPACTGRPGLPLLPASSARPGLPLSAPANGFDDERHRQSPSHHSFESVIYT